eukprot:RCo016641
MKFGIGWDPDFPFREQTFPVWWHPDGKYGSEEYRLADFRATRDPVLVALEPPVRDKRGNFDSDLSIQEYTSWMKWEFAVFQKEIGLVRAEFTSCMYRNSAIMKKLACLDLKKKYFDFGHLRQNYYRALLLKTEMPLTRNVLYETRPSPKSK